MQRRVRILAECIARLLPRDIDVLDVGCGDGRIGRAVMDLRPDVQVRGIDVMLRPTTAIPVERFDGELIDLPSRGVGAVIMVDVVHHARNPVALVKEAARISAHALVIKDHLRDGVLAAATLRAMDWVGNAPHGVVLPYNYLAREEWNEAFKAAEVTIDAWEGALALYPRPASYIFGRGFHFVARLKHVDR
jgi:SAM-dependent methyltransferase